MMISSEVPEPPSPWGTLESGELETMALTFFFTLGTFHGNWYRLEFDGDSPTFLKMVYPLVN